MNAHTSALLICLAFCSSHSFAVEQVRDSLPEGSQAQWNEINPDTTVSSARPGEEINFSMKLFRSNHHLIEGRATSDIGKANFKSRLMPSNEVKLSISLKQRELDDVELVAYFDLAHYTMELDGANAVLNQAHKSLIRTITSHLGMAFGEQYEGLDIPEHAFMLVQMLSYWAMSPEGYVHAKREIVSQ